MIIYFLQLLLLILTVNTLAVVLVYNVNVLLRTFYVLLYRTKL